MAARRGLSLVRALGGRSAASCRHQPRVLSVSLLNGPARRSIATTSDLGEAESTASPSAHIHGHVQARLDYRKLVENVDAAVENCRKRFNDADPRLVAELYQRQARLTHEANQLRAERNAHAKQLGQAAARKKDDAQAFETLRAHGQQLKKQIAATEDELEAVRAQLELEALKIPNDTHPDAPIGDEDASVVVSAHGDKPLFDGFEPKDHFDLMTDLRLLDMSAAAKIAGSKFMMLCNEGAMLELALVHWTLSKLRARGFTVLFPPDVAHYKMVEGCGFQPRGEATQIYSLANSDLCLAATSEISLASLHSNEILDSHDLPMRLAGFSHCFRTEIGHGGKQTRGIYRIHQFSKVEMFGFAADMTQAERFFHEMVDIQRELCSELGLHFQVVDMASGDLGAPAYRKFDVLAWMPGRQEYGEVASISMCTDYQARRLNIRHRPSKDEPTAFAHTLNGTACAVPRLIISLLETHQQADGSVVIPEVLRPYMGMQEVIKPQA
jgi:seryl-tRNA synthetase